MNEKKIYRGAMIVIGNEVLSGRTQDKNIHYVANALTDHGIRLSEVRVIPDIEQEIIDAVLMLSDKYDYVFTSGGIGPTHDDITAESMAKAFGRDIELNPDAHDLLKEYYGEEDVSDARLKMAHVPEDVMLIANPVSGAPGFQIKNVYVMAGVPRIMQSMLDGIVGDMAGGDKMLSTTIECSFYESDIASGLNDIQDKYLNVDIGSYPSSSREGPIVNIVLRGTDVRVLDEVFALVHNMLKKLK
jgi:molybdenum cofactor synthesis domain-containing protein